MVDIVCSCSVPPQVISNHPVDFLVGWSEEGLQFLHQLGFEVGHFFLPPCIDIYGQAAFW